MDFLTRSTIISPLTLIRRERMLPDVGTVVAKIGQEVSPVQVVARAPLKMNFQVIPVGKILGLSPAEVANSLLVNVGMTVDQGTPLIKKSGVGRKPFTSPVDGTLYDVANGNLVFRQISDYVELRSLARGRVVNHLGNRGVVLEINGSRIQAAWHSGKEGYGTLHVAVETAVTPFTGSQIYADVAKQVLVTGIVNDAEALQQAERAAISGLIAGSITADLLPLAKSLGFPIFITSGIGKQGMAQPVFNLLQKSEAREVALFTPLYNQFGSRAEIIIPLEVVSKDVVPPAERPLSAGQSVRIVRPPYENRIGTVKRIFQQKHLTEIGTWVHGADIELADGTAVFVPIANLEAIF
ncbi:MAG: hypothetical protein H6667_14625 [Ardenticatenaceae bacterium]|nr:hypothetical protein [Ardenticatenaceae bacterium]MCB9445526.1 hypothetical protein [Ardenticatenaceae bacterium]